jgi:PQQ-dependent dehydrogenase (methanol/ethanol family)
MSIDARNCRPRWTHDYRPDQREPVPTNRGVAVMNGRVYRGTGDARVIALDGETGRIVWKSVVGDPLRGETVSGVPMTWNGLVYVGLAGGALGIRGRITALDANTGREVWRFDTTPEGEAAGADTWKWPEDLVHGGGGGGSWTSFALDPSSRELFVPVGSPAPVFANAFRPGDNLFTNSLVVLDALTGELKWWYQLAPNDGRDYDLAAAPILYHDDQQRSVVAFAGKNGYAYALDRATRKVLFRTPVTTIVNESKSPTPAGVRFCPGMIGGTEWNGPALDPARKLLFVGAIDWCNVLKSERPVYRVGAEYWGGSWIYDEKKTGWITAIDRETGAVRWRYDAGSPVVAALTPTAGGVVFAGTTGGDFLVLDSSTGAVLQKRASGGGMAGGIVTYQLDGKQYVAFATGNVSRGALGTVGAPTLVILRADPPASLGARGDPARGQALFDSVCASCHGQSGISVAQNSLAGLSARLSFEQTVTAIMNPRPPMPKLSPGQLSAQDVADIATYLQAEP